MVNTIIFYAGGIQGKDFESFVYSMVMMPDGPGHLKLYCIKVIEGPTGELEQYAITGNIVTKQIGCQEKVMIEKFKWEHERINAIQWLVEYSWMQGMH